MMVLLLADRGRLRNSRSAARRDTSVFESFDREVGDGFSGRGNRAARQVGCGGAERPQDDGNQDALAAACSVAITHERVVFILAPEVPRCDGR